MEHTKQRLMMVRLPMPRMTTTHTLIPTLALVLVLAPVLVVALMLALVLALLPQSNKTL